MDTEGPKPTNGDILNKLKEESCEQGVISFIVIYMSCNRLSFAKHISVLIDF